MKISSSLRWSLNEPVPKENDQAAANKSAKHFNEPIFYRLLRDTRSQAFHAAFYNDAATRKRKSSALI